MQKEQILKLVEESAFYKLNKDGSRIVYVNMDVLSNAIDKLSLPVEAGVKPACDPTERPRIEDYFPEDMTVGMLNNTFLENKELYNYIQALDNYIDEIESKSV